MNTDYKILWKNCLDVIRDIIPEAAFNTWFSPIVPLKYEDNVLTIQVPSQFFYEYLEDKYIDLIQQTLYRKIGEGTIQLPSWWSGKQYYGGDARGPKFTFQTRKNQNRFL